MSRVETKELWRNRKASLGARLLILREKAGLKLNLCAKVLDISQSKLRAIEEGYGSVPAHLLIDIAILYNVHVDTILQGMFFKKIRTVEDIPNFLGKEIKNAFKTHRDREHR